VCLNEGGVLFLRPAGCLARDAMEGTAGSGYCLMLAWRVATLAASLSAGATASMAASGVGAPGNTPGAASVRPARRAAACRWPARGVMNAGALWFTVGWDNKPAIDAMLARLNEMVNAATTAIKKRRGVASGTRFKNCSTNNHG
jgi:hypothetical protein